MISNNNSYTYLKIVVKNRIILIIDLFFLCILTAILLFPCNDNPSLSMSSNIFSTENIYYE